MPDEKKAEEADIMTGCLTLLLVFVLTITGHWWIPFVLLILTFLCRRNRS